MDTVDHKIPTASSGIHLCNKCGWPFPNPHPSARHRRAHKRVCGTIEGYKTIQSESNDHPLAVSDDEHSVDNNEHTPSPNIGKRNAKEFSYSVEVGQRSNRSEDDVFQDAAAEFSDSGISPRLEEQSERAKGVVKSVELKTVENDLSASQPGKVDDTAGRTKQPDNPTGSDQMCNPGSLINAMDQFDNGLLVDDTGTESVSRNHLQPDMIESESLRNLSNGSINESGIVETEELIKTGQDTDIQSEKEILPSANLDFEEDKTSDGASIEGKDSDKLAPEVVEHDPECSDVVSNVSLSDAEVMQKNSSCVGENAGNSDPSEEDKCHNAGNENGYQETLVKYSSEIVSAQDCAVTHFAPEFNGTKGVIKEDVIDNDEGVNGKHLKAVNEMGDGSATGIQVTLDLAKGSANSESLTSCEVDDDAENPGERLETEADLLDSYDNNFVISLQQSGTTAITEILQEVSSPGVVTRTDHDTGNVLDKSLSSTTMDDPVSLLVNSEEPRKTHMTSDVEGGVPDETAGSVSDSVLGDDMAAAEKSPEHPTLEKLTPMVIDSEILCKSKPNESISTIDGFPDAKADIELNNDGNISMRNESNGTLKVLNPISRSDSLEGKRGSVSDTSETHSQEPKTTTEEGRPEKPDVSDPPSEMEKMQNNQELRSDALQTSDITSPSNVANESENKKNEEIIDNVKNWSPKRQHSQLKDLMRVAESPNTKHEDANRKEWDSPARYSAEIKKEKKKVKPYWVPFVCCSSIH